MKTIRGYFKAYDEIEIEDNATEEEIKQKMADSLGLYYSIMLRPEHIIIEGEVEPRLKEEKNISQSMPSSEGRGL